MCCHLSDQSRYQLTPTLEADWMRSGVTKAWLMPHTESWLARGGTMANRMGAAKAVPPGRAEAVIW